MLLSQKTYKVGFYVLLAILIVIAFLFFMDISRSKSSFNPETPRTDTTTITQTTIDTLATPEQEKFRQLVDSVHSVKDSIRNIVNEMNKILEDSTLTISEQRKFGSTYIELSDLSFQLDFKVDNARVQILEEESQKLDTLLQTFDKKSNKLKRLGVRIEKLNKFLKIGIKGLKAAIKLI